MSPNVGSNLGPNLGKTAPDFTLNDADGVSIRLSQLRGQWVVLYFYPRDNTPGCTKEACGFRDRHDAFVAQNIRVLGLSADDSSAHQKFAKKFGLPFTLLCDPEGAIAKTYESYGPKKFMGKTYEGIYRQTFVMNPAGEIVKIYRKVKPEHHAKEVLQDIADLQR
jgi:thioredoxin-dependent peroxiredoxin